MSYLVYPKLMSQRNHKLATDQCYLCFSFLSYVSYFIQLLVNPVRATGESFPHRQPFSDYLNLSRNVQPVKGFLAVSKFIIIVDLLRING